ncbi:MAG TPA: type II secretion system protein [Rhizomicrobium sp.]|nr:type II secretion system protein [Rhizomicrobium sp.]
MRDERGFTLLEVLVALTILGVALTVLFGIFGHSLSRARETQSRLEARTLASSLLAEAETAPALAYGDRGGRVQSGMDWQLSVRPYGDDKDLQAWPSAAAQVSATVRWGDRGPGQSLTLTTLRLLPKKTQP